MPQEIGQCAICGDTGPLVRDHDHRTSYIRGLICRRCNAMLGYALDSPRRLIRAVAYLEREQTALVYPGASPAVVWPPAMSEDDFDGIVARARARNELLGRMHARDIFDPDAEQAREDEVRLIVEVGRVRAWRDE